MNLFEPMHLLILALVLLLFFGGRKIPELMRGIGQGVGELQKGLNDAKRTMNTALDQDAAATPTQPRQEPSALETATAVNTAKTESQNVQAS